MRRAFKITGDTPIYKPTFEFQETTMQVPFGESSFLSALFAGEIGPVEAMTLLYANYRSNYQRGRTHWITSRQFAEVFELSVSYVRQRLRGLRTWMDTVKTGVDGKIYQLKPYSCDADDVPTDALGDPLTFAVPRGEGGPIERLEAGDISWRACLIWIVLKFYSDWKTGRTDRISMKELAKRVGMGKKSVCACIKELQDAGMVKRISRPWETSCFQLYPRPPEKSDAQRLKEKRERNKMSGTLKLGKYEVTVNKDYAYSANWQWRIRFEDGDYERRKGRTWKRVSDSERHKIPKAVFRDLEKALAIRRQINLKTGGSHSNTLGSHNTTLGSHSNTPKNKGGYKPLWYLG